MTARPAPAVPEERPEPAADAAATRVAELERRIAELSSQDEAAFGRFSGADWLLCAALGLAVPAAALWWFAR